MINILIPCAGSGQRFLDAGYELPKPMIPINGIPMIKRVVDSLGLPGQYIFVVQEEHEKKFGMSTFLKTTYPESRIILISGKTDGAVCTCLLAREFIANKNPLIIANSDQIVDFDRPLFLGNTLYYDGCTLTFPAFDSKWSFCLTDSKGRVNTVAEKNRISTVANCGIYSWKTGYDFVCDAMNMMNNEQNRVNREWYIAPVFNEMIKDGLHVQSQQVISMWPCGTPVDLKNTEEIIKMREKL